MAADAEWTTIAIDGETPEVVLQARPRRGFARLFAGTFGRLLLPAILAQSILVGGGYASGREVVEFGARFGALGWIAALTIFVGFTLVSILVFEFARIRKAYDYQSFIRGLIGPLWPLFDILFAAMAVLVIAVMASAAGAIMRTTLGVPALVGILVIVAMVGVLVFHGDRVIEVFKTMGTVLLYVGYALFGIVVLTRGWGNVAQVFASGDTSHGGGAGPWAVAGVGILYVGYNLSVYPAVLFTLHRQRRTRDSVLAGIIAGLTMTLPFVVTYLAVLAFYDAGDVITAEVPWLPMLEASGGAWLVVLFGVVVGWTLLETSVGLIHAVLDRVDRALPRALGPWQKAASGALALAGAALLAQIGVIDLIASGYTAMAYAFLALFALPLFTIGVVRIAQARRQARVEADAGAAGAAAGSAG